MPTKVRWAYAVLLGTLWFDTLRIRRQVVLDNITKVYPDWPQDQKVKLARLSMYHLCYGVLEFLVLARERENWFKKAKFIGLEHYQKALAQGKGVLLLSLHTGNGDVGISMMNRLGNKVSLIAKKMTTPAANDLLYGERAKFGSDYIDAHNPKNAFQIMGALKKNEGIIFVIDQFMGKPFGIKTTFFGIETGTAYGLAVFALKTKAPVLPIYTYRDENLNPVVEVFPEMVFNHESEDRDEQIHYMTQEFNYKIEEMIKKLPEQWMWLHKRWKKWE